VPRKSAKLMAGAVMAGLGFYILTGEAFSIISNDAVINARVAIVRSPIDGVLNLKSLMIGRRVQAREALGSVTDERVDDARVRDLERNAGDLEAESSLLQAKLRNLTETRAELTGRTLSYQEGRLRQLRAQIHEAEALLAGARATTQELEASLSRAEELKAKGIQSAAVFDRASTSHSVAALAAKAAAARVETLKIQLAAAAKGTFLGDSYNDTPYSSQRTVEVDLLAAELRATLEERTSRLARVQDHIAVERQRLNRMHEAFLTSPVEGRVWEVALGAGEYARKGQDILRLLDCSTMVVTASVGEKDYNSLRVGDPARFRLAGTRTSYDAVVLRLAGSGAATVYNNMAISPGPAHLQRYDVALSVSGLLNDPEANCAVGRTGRLSFSTGSDMVNQVRTWLGL
jgi:multidrug resistance efflux pump